MDLYRTVVRPRAAHNVRAPSGPVAAARGIFMLAASRWLLVAALISAASCHLSPPANVSGTFRGAWSAVAGGDAHAAVPPLTPWVVGGNGSVLVVLTARESETQGVHLVKCDVLLAGSGVAAEVRLVAEGLYVPQTGELRLRAARSHVVQDVTLDESGPALRRAQAGAALEAAKLAAASHGGRRHQPLLSQQPRGGRWNSTGLRRMCDFELSVKLPPQAEATTAWHRRSDVRLLGLLNSPSCRTAIQLNATKLNTAALLLKAKNVASLTATTGIAIISLTARQMELSSGGSSVTQVSLACILHQGVLDSAFTLVHLTGGLMVDALFASFTSCALVYFILFSFFEMRWMTLIARARAPSAPWREELNALQTRFYMALVGSAAFVWLVKDSPTMLALVYGSFWLWQIVHTAVEDAARPFTHRYVIGVALARLPIPLYLLACPENWLNLAPVPRAAIVLVLWVAAQTLVLCAQIQYGARCFVPQRWRPLRYSYARTATPAERAAATSDAETGTVDCVVCMLPLDLDALEGRMLTPCGHVFHTECLERWMAIRQECPVCRRTLPLP